MQWGVAFTPVAPELLTLVRMNRTDIESGKDDGSLLIGHAHGVSGDEDDQIIELDEDDILADEHEEDAGDLDFEPEYDRDF